MPVLYTNNATSTLAASITNVATSMSVASGQGARFPAPGGSDYFYATLSDSAGNIEIVKVTARSTDTLTIVRAQDGTSARAWAAGDAFELRMVRAMLDDFKTDTRGSITTAGMGGNTVYLLGTTSSSAGTSQPLVGSGLSYNATNGTLTVPGGTVLHASNYSSYALPATGGTLTGNLTVAGDITIGSAKRYLGDFSNLTVASRGIFQSNTINGSTFVTAMPNGTGTATQYQAYNSSDPANASFGSIGVTANQVRIVSSNTGTGSLNPITFLFGTTEVARFTTSGDLLIGTTTDDGVNLLQVTGGTALTGALTIRAANELRLADTDSSNYVGFKSAGTVSANVIWTLPATDGTSGQYMVTNGTGTLSWASPGASLTGLTQSSGSFITSLGSGAGQSGSGGAVTIGYQAGQSNSYGGGGVHIGYQAGKASIGGNITIGSSAGVALGYGPYCTIIGTGAGTTISSATSTTIIGGEAGKQCGNVDNLTAIGTMSGFYAGGNGSTLLGSRAGYYSGGIERVALGFYSMRGSPNWDTTGGYNVGVGAYSLYSYTSGEKSVAVGHSALYSATTAKWNVAVGHNAGYGVTTGNNNTLIGYLAGYGTNALTSGVNNICIGYTADASAATVSNEITIGNSTNNRFRIPGLGIDWTSSNTPAVGPTFRAIRGTAQTVTANAWNKAQCNTEQFDTDAAYDNATNFRFQPTRAGYYLVTGNSAAAYSTIPSIWKNGSEYQTAGWGSGGSHMTVTALVYLNGSTDYVEFYIWTDGTSFYQDQTAFSAVFVRA